MRRRHRAGPSDPCPGPAPPDPEQAWKALALVNDWVKHAEIKLAVTLTATGVSGGMLFNLVKDRGHYSLLYDLAATICGASVIVVGIFAVIGLYPRMTLRRAAPENTPNPLFFHDVARAYKGDAPTYGAILHTLTTNPDDLVRHISQQVHANATVAQRNTSGPTERSGPDHRPAGAWCCGNYHRPEGVRPAWTAITRPTTTWRTSRASMASWPNRSRTSRKSTNSRTATAYRQLSDHGRRLLNQAMFKELLLDRDELTTQVVGQTYTEPVRDLMKRGTAAQDLSPTQGDAAVIAGWPWQRRGRSAAQSNPLAR